MKEKILTEAEKILIEEGFHALSMRRIATACDTGTGNVTYYFRTKIDLLDAMFAAILERYRTSMLADGIQSPNTSLGDLLSWLMRDSSREMTVSLFTELWAMGRQIEAGARCLAILYRNSIADGEAFLEERYPDAKPRDIRLAARLLQTVVEGSVPMSIALHGNEAYPGAQDVEFAAQAIEGLLQVRSRR